MLFYGVLSFILGWVKFNAPDIQGATTDLREIPLLISVFHISNPWVTVGACLISSGSTLSDGSYLSSFLMHMISVFISWYIYRYFSRLNIQSYKLGIIWFIYVAFYYLLLLYPILIITNYLVGINTEKGFIPFYLGMVSPSRFEIITTALITSLYLIQHKMRLALQQHKADLEATVKVRTDELVTTIKELKATQQQLIQTEKMASLGTLTAGVAHEINNPLNFIAGGLYLIEDIQKEECIQKGVNTEEFNTAIESIKEGLERATGIVKSLMDFSHWGSHVLVECNIHNIIDNTLQFMSFMLKDITIVKEYNLQENVFLFPEKIHQVIMYLVDNAIYAINLDTANARKIIISTYSIGDTAVLKISNTGPKIPEKDLNQIFDPFFTTKDPGKGKGIGLSICYTLISEHKGVIFAKNEDDAVTFTIEIPMKNNRQQ